MYSANLALKTAHTQSLHQATFFHGVLIPRVLQLPLSTKETVLVKMFPLGQLVLKRQSLQQAVHPGSLGKSCVRPLTGSVLS